MKIEHKSIKELQQKGAVTLMEGLATIPGVSQVSTGISIGKQFHMYQFSILF